MTGLDHTQQGEMLDCNGGKMLEGKEWQRLLALAAERKEGQSKINAISIDSISC